MRRTDIAGRVAVCVCLTAALCAIGLSSGVSAKDSPSVALAKKSLTLESATMCESIEAYKPNASAVVFSVTIGRVSCFTAFDPVLRKTMIQHQWYFRDKLITTKRLHLRPPKWATYSSIQPRQADIGPWRVDIIDPEGNVIRSLRFSIVQ
jgi:hypothetical protein